MSNVFRGLYKFGYNMAAFVLCLALFFGIVSEASACPSAEPCGRCIWKAVENRCVRRGIPFSGSREDDLSLDLLSPADTLNSPNSDPLTPSSGTVAPPIGNPAP
jgi:hypothetical protein